MGVHAECSLLFPLLLLSLICLSASSLSFVPHASVSSTRQPSPLATHSLSISRGGSTAAVSLGEDEESYEGEDNDEDKDEGVVPCAPESARPERCGWSIFFNSSPPE